MKKIAFELDAFKQLEQWEKTDKKVLKKISALIENYENQNIPKLPE